MREEKELLQGFNLKGSNVKLFSVKKETGLIFRVIATKIFPMDVKTTTIDSDSTETAFFMFDSIVDSMRFREKLEVLAV